MEMIKSRILTPHTYNRETAKLIVRKILDDFFSGIKTLLLTLEKKQKDELT